jgi:hypothetical protein
MRQNANPDFSELLPPSLVCLRVAVASATRSARPSPSPSRDGWPCVCGRLEKELRQMPKVLLALIAFGGLVLIGAFVAAAFSL